jgi:uncharacterized membrane protein (DUF373 family)
MGLLLGFFGGLAVLAVIVIARELGLVPARFADRYQLAALIALLVVVPLLGAVLGFLEGRAKLD